MPQSSKKPSTVTLAVEPEYKLSPWYQSATPSQVGAALSRGATEMQREPSSSLHLQQEALLAREEQLQTHEAALQSVLHEVRTQSEASRAVLQSRIDELTARGEERAEAMARVTAERDALLGNEPDHAAPVGEHLALLTTHATEMFELYANHDALLRQLDASITAIRAKAMVWYRRVKRTELASTHNLALPWEHAYEHAIGRVWNNLTTAKARELERHLGRKAAELAIAQEETRQGDPDEKRQRTAGSDGPAAA